ncbi:MAG: hypothetical protein CM1200mP27_00430 [Chloroflexota bacterium]|nr:MAG: hypothetical protein CM1200mP27_00430 [Chloroflexota bacterium]
MWGVQDENIVMLRTSLVPTVILSEMCEAFWSLEIRRSNVFGRLWIKPPLPAEFPFQELNCFLRSYSRLLFVIS